ncbi:hypothetical protein PHYC_03078 [Phycisphaerales bacterium]|nr:hypothetical protein PHYC_03078 [Phycisphaerales bacterium]
MTPARPLSNARRPGGFTLIELVLASVIGVLVAGAVMSSMSQFLRARSVVNARQQAFSRADAAASRIAIDIQNVIRDQDLLYAQVAILNGLSLTGDGDELLLLAKGTRPVRGDRFSPEGEDFEVQYRVEPNPVDDRPALWRRVDPGFDPYLDGGGVAAPIVAGVTSLSLNAYDGVNWYDEWQSDEVGMPHAIKVTVVGTSDDGKVRATARRIVAIDRVPLPPPEEEDSDSGETTPTSPSGNSGSGATGGGGAGGGGTGGGGAGGGGTGGGGTGGGGTGGGGSGTPRTGGPR